MIHNVWNYPVGIYDNVLDLTEFSDAIQQLDQQHVTKNMFYDSFEHKSLPNWLAPLGQRLCAVFETFCKESGIENQYEPIFYQTLRTEHYGRHTAFNGSWEPHNDIYERANWSVTYYLSVDDESVLPDGYIGGELSLMDRLDYATYPDSVQLINLHQNRIVIFSPLKTHRIRPYFGKKPRLSISQFWGRDISAMSPNAQRIL